MANKKINELTVRTPALSDLMIVGDPSSGYSFKCTVTALATIIETDIADGFVTIATAQTISGAKTFSNIVTLTSVANSPSVGSKFLILNASNVVNYRTAAEVLSDIGGQGTLTLTTTGTSGAATLVANTLNIPQYQAVLSGTGIVKSTGGTISYLTDNSTNWNSAYDNMIVSAAVSGSTTKTLTLTQQDSGTITASWTDDNTGTVTSVAATGGTGISVSGSPITSSGTLTITNTAPDQTVVLTAGTGISVSGTYPNFTITNSSPSSGGTVTSVAALTLGTTGTDLSSSVANGTTTPVITLNVPTASATNRGALSSTDWSTFNNKQSAITLTTTGSSGSATFVSNTLNVPTYTLAGLGGISGAGTTNYIPKFTSSSAIGNSIMYEGTYGIGLGTTGPQSSINNLATTIQVYQNSANGSSLKLSSALSNTELYQADGALYLWNYGGSGTPILFGTNNTERLRISSTGDVIVGGTSASYSASGRGNITIGGSSTSILAFQTGGSDKGYLYHDATNLNLNNAANGTLLFGTNNSTKMTLDASGNLGLGVTPSAWGGGYIAYQSNLTGVYASNGSNGTVLGHNFYYDGTNDKYLTTGVASRVFLFQGAIRFDLAASGSAGSNLSFTQAMTLDASGNLGIGTTSPAYQLDLGGGTTVNQRIRLQRGSDDANQYGTYGWNQINVYRANVALASPQSDFSINQVGSDGSRTPFYISSSGNVGIGTSSPSELLHIRKDQTAYTWARIDNQANNAAAYAGLQLGAYGNSWGIAIGSSLANSNALSFVIDAGGGNTERMRITSGGDVGIGNSSPSTFSGGGLSIGSTSSGKNIMMFSTSAGNNGLIQFFDTGANNAFQLGVTTTSMSLYGYGARSMLFYTNDTERMRITSGGNVVIGNTVASNVGLTIYGSNAATIYQTANTGTGAGNGFYVGHTSDISYLWNYNNYPTVFGTNNTERMRITSGGELLINTTSDAGDFKLQVNGNSYVKGSFLLNDYIGATANNWEMYHYNDNTLRLNYNGAGNDEFILSTGGNLELLGSIKTAAPSGGNAQPWKLGEVSNSGYDIFSGAAFTDQVISIDINGTVYYVPVVDPSYC